MGRNGGFTDICLTSTLANGCISSIYIIHNSIVDTAVNHQKKGLYFGLMISCETGRSSFDYLDYGCFCGLGGAGTPVDDLDKYVYI